MAVEDPFGHRFAALETRSLERRRVRHLLALLWWPPFVPLDPAEMDDRHVAGFELDLLRATRAFEIGRRDWLARVAIERVARERIAVQPPSRERFITELTLDAPQAPGDEAGPPLPDDDYPILSTVHSAKGQEWDSVFVLNVNDGSFPSEFAAGKTAQVEEERRLLKVAMTRAKRDLHLVAPLKFYVTQQSRWGDKHVYGARGRILTEPVLAAFESRVWSTESGTASRRWALLTLSWTSTTYGTPGHPQRMIPGATGSGART